MICLSTKKLLSKVTTEQVGQTLPRNASLNNSGALQCFSPSLFQRKIITHPGLKA